MTSSSCISTGLRTVLLSALLLPASVLAQSGAGAIQGSVQDPTSAAIPSCKVHVVNQGTGVVNDTVSNSTGFYSVPGLFAGSYTLTFTAPGMKKYQTVVALQNAQVAVVNATLEVGAVTEQVTVSAEVLQLATYDSGTVSTQLDSNRIDRCRRTAVTCSAWRRTPSPASSPVAPAPTD